MPLTDEERTLTISETMKWNFGNALTWERPKLAHTFGENDLEYVETFETELTETKAKVLDILKKLPDEDMSRIKDELADKFRISERNKAAVLSNQVRSLSSSIPPAIAYGLGHPNFSARFQYWSRMPELGLHEVTVLSLGADPTLMTEDMVNKFVKAQKERKKLWAAQKSILDQWEIFRRCYSFTGWGHAAEPISRIKRMIDELNIMVHPEFYAGLEARLRPKIQNVAEKDQKPLSSQERNTLLKMIAGMSCEQYSYNPNLDRNGATSRISDDIELIGQSLDAKTIRKLLKEASLLVDEKYWQS